MMVNSSRPLLRSSAGRISSRRSRANSPATDEDEKSSTTTVPLTKRSILPNKIRTSTSNSKDIAAPASHPRVKLLGPKPALTQSRKKPTRRPPTRVTVTQPHGGLLQTTNGVQTQLEIRADDIPSRVSTPVSTASDTNGAVSQTTALGQDKRTLRSQDGGSRLKSDLSTYFLDYDEIIAHGPRKPEFLGFDEPISIVDESAKTSSRDTTTPSKPKRPSIGPLDAYFKPKPQPEPSPSVSPASPRDTELPTRPDTAITSFETVDLAKLAEGSASMQDNIDPLADPIYLLQHRRAERKEKQLRNIEKERAQHEKQQLERLLDGLKGPDWLRVMGVTGITDGERRDWEPKRSYFIAEVSALVDKFRQWKEGEKRLKMEREAALLAKEEEEGEETDEGSVENDEVEEPGTDPPPSNDVDACAARQLLQEATSATQRVRKPRTRHLEQPTYLPPPEVDPNKPFTSFYSKPHLRAAALGKHRHGRTVLAFGHPIPDFGESEFSLPGDYLTPEALRDHARKRRRMRRDIDAIRGKRVA